MTASEIRALFAVASRIAIQHGFAENGDQMVMTADQMTMTADTGPSGGVDWRAGDFRLGGLVGGMR